jgi:hypothetical protein
LVRLFGYFPFFCHKPTTDLNHAWSTGGAERLVVDAAVGLQKRGHTVEIFTSYHEDGKNGRSFEETRDGTLLHLFPLYQ